MFCGRLRHEIEQYHVFLIRCYRVRCTLACPGRGSNIWLETLKLIIKSPGGYHTFNTGLIVYHFRNHYTPRIYDVLIYKHRLPVNLHLRTPG